MSGPVSIREELARSGRIVFTNVGVSMMPLIRQGKDVMVIEARKPEEIRRYDAVLFRRPQVRGRGEYVLHRVLKCCPDGRFWIVGDNCASGEMVEPENVLGVLTALQRNGRTLRPTDLSCRLYVALWCAPWPLRFALLRARRLLGRVKNRLLGRGKT